MVFNEQHFPFHDGFLNKRKVAETVNDPPNLLFPIVTTCTNPTNNTWRDIDNEHAAAEDQVTSNTQVSSSSDNLEEVSSRHSGSSPSSRSRGDSQIEPQQPVITTPDSHNSRSENAEEPNNQHHMMTRSKAGVSKPKRPYIGAAEKQQEEHEPETVNEALKKP